MKNHPAAYSDLVFGDTVTDYLNTDAVKTAFHIPNELKYEECSNKVGANWHYQEEASEWIYKVLKNNGIKMLHYSGDTDAAVPTYGTHRWIKSLHWDITEAWRPWYTTHPTEGDQVSGYVEVYDGLTFVTVKGVGHMAPQWARQPVQEMVHAFIHGEKF